MKLANGQCLELTCAFAVAKVTCCTAAAKRMENFEFVKWCEEYELEETTINLLVDKGYKSYKSLRTLTDDAISRIFKTLIPGQLALLKEGVDLLKPKDSATDNPQAAPVTETASSQVPNAATTSAPPAATTMNPEEVCALWEKVVGIQQGQTSHAPSASIEETPSDPFGLGTGSHKGEKYRKLSNYVTHQFAQDPFPEEETLEIGGVMFKRGDKKVAPKNIGISQYMEGALRILREMVVEEGISIPQILNHINYLIQISCFAQSKTWASVLSYDTIYRREQHAHGFSWGQQSAFLMATLMPKEVTNNPASKNKPKPDFNPNTKNTICGRWNSRLGCQLPQCRYDHACRICFSTDHPAVQHSSAGQISKNK